MEKSRKKTIDELTDPGFELLIEKLSKHPKFQKIANTMCFDLLSNGKAHYKISPDLLEELLVEIFDDLNITEAEWEAVYYYDKSKIN